MISIDESKVRQMLCDIAIKLATDTSDDYEEHKNQSIGMMIMCVNLGIISERELSILLSYTEHGTLTDDFIDDFVDGLYHYAPDLPQDKIF